VFFWESFVTELAHRAGIDQYAYRRELLKHDPLALRVLDAAAKAAAWGEPTVDRFLGISFNCYIGRGGRFKTYVAEVVVLEPDGDFDGNLAVQEVICAVDAGQVVNPNTLVAQIEGGIGFAMTTALHSRITFAQGGAEQANFDGYRLLTMAEMPNVRSIVLPSERPPQGFGEVVLAPLAPAIAQAVFHAKGRRIDVMPLPAEAFAWPT
jgi:isoquinoline 1-oxidoreductase beta subunit